MPAHRSGDEQELRAAVADRLRELRPSARILHEINVAGGTVRVDITAASPEEIITAEIKSKRDKLDRLPEQLKRMRACAHLAIAARHEKCLVEQKCSKYEAHRVLDGTCYMDKEPDEAKDAHMTWPISETGPHPRPAHCDSDPGHDARSRQLSRALSRSMCISGFRGYNLHGYQ